MPETSYVSSVRVLEDKVLAELGRLARFAAPSEAVGLLTLDDRVISLPNHSESPETSFELARSDLINALRMHELEPDGLVLWHSHPGGGVGPSRTDMQNRLPFMAHLVVTIGSEEITTTWY